MSLLVLSESDVNRTIEGVTPDQLIKLMAAVFVCLHQNEGVASPQRLSVKSTAFSTLFMPSHMDQGPQDQPCTAIKIVSLPEKSTAKGLPASTLLLDETTGSAKAVINAGRLTALRNAAGSLLVTTLLGPTEPRILVVFGAGNQIDAHVDLFIKKFPSIVECTIVNRSENERLRNLCGSLVGRFTNVRFKAACSTNKTLDLQSVVGAADIIVAATSSTEPLFKTGWVKPGTHVNLIGSYKPKMHEVEASLLHRAGKVVVDSREACLAEAGELIAAKLDEQNVVQIGQIIEKDGSAITKEVDAVRGAGDVTVFKSVGVGVQDVAIAALVYERAVAFNMGTEIPNYS